MLKLFEYVLTLDEEEAEDLLDSAKYLSGVEPYIFCLEALCSMVDED